jgi:hypothetical protein
MLDAKDTPIELLIGMSRGDRPLPNISGFKRLTETHSEEQIRQLNLWIEQQAECSTIIKYHGKKGLQQVLEGIARASVAKGVPMQRRVRSIAEWLGLV